jgi:hypothetical protein
MNKSQTQNASKLSQAKRGVLGFTTESKFTNQSTIVAHCKNHICQICSALSVKYNSRILPWVHSLKFSTKNLFDEIGPRYQMIQSNYPEPLVVLISFLALWKCASS